MNLGKWERVRLGLRISAAMTGSLLPFVGTGIIGMALTAYTAGAAMLSVEIPRDKWNEADKLNKLSRRSRRNTRNNPLMSFLLWFLFWRL